VNLGGTTNACTPAREEEDMTAQTGLNGIDGIKMALERHGFADIMTASVEIQSRLVLKVPLTEADCALQA
jgi:hypothetical protein